MYLLKIQLRDTTIECSSMATLDRAYDAVLASSNKLGIPPENIILIKVETRVSDFTGNAEEKMLGTNVVTKRAR